MKLLGGWLADCLPVWRCPSRLLLQRPRILSSNRLEALLECRSWANCPRRV